MLILALNHLDLTDLHTWKAVESALMYIRALLDDFNGFRCTLSHLSPASGALKQWHRLRSLVNPLWKGNMRKENEKEKKQEKDGGRGEENNVKMSTSSVRQTRLPHSDKCGISEGAFYPNKRVIRMALEADARADTVDKAENWSHNL
eukprot:Skav233321  [mRNA]  locus=scaffold3767:306787:310219:- [translate_table: standard]